MSTKKQQQTRVRNHQLFMLHGCIGLINNIINAYEKVFLTSRVRSKCERAIGSLKDVIDEIKDDVTSRDYIK